MDGAGGGRMRSYRLQAIVTVTVRVVIYVILITVT
jgi:hypothetical protein